MRRRSDDRAAERQRRAYARRCLGMIVAPVETDAVITDMLTDLGWLGADAHDRAAVAAAISALLHQAQLFLTRENEGAALRGMIGRKDPAE